MRMIRTFIVAAALTAGPAYAAENLGEMVLYKNPQCSCCEEYAKYLRANGFEVKLVATHDLSMIKKKHGVPENLEGCHTSLVSGYVVEGHVPVATLKRLVSEKPAIKGISLPGMPLGTPGMGGEKQGPLTIYEISSGASKVYAQE